MDQYLLNIRTGQLQNLSNTPTVWDEHGVISYGQKKRERERDLHVGISIPQRSEIFHRNGPQNRVHDDR